MEFGVGQRLNQIYFESGKREYSMGELKTIFATRRKTIKKHLDKLILIGVMDKLFNVENGRTEYIFKPQNFYEWIGEDKYEMHKARD